jgi:uncharacterized iron-regulated membrane protein
MREVLLFVHRWLGLTAGVIFAIASLTGGILVYEIPLDRLMAGPKLLTTDGVIEPAALEAAIGEIRPDARILRVEWPTRDNAFRVAVDTGGAPENLVLDAGSGRLVEPRQNHILLRAIRRLHVNLFAGPIGGLIVTWTSAIALVAMVLGVYLWWPGIRRFWRGFQVRVRRDFYILNFDLHQVLGMVTLPVLIVMTATGVLFSMPRIVDRITVTLHGNVWVESEWSRLRSAPIDSIAPPPPEPTFTAVTNLALVTAGGGSLTLVTFPAAENGIIDVAMHDSPGTGAGDTTRIAIDRYTGEVLSTQVVSPRFIYDRAMNDRLHFGNVGGPIVGALYAFACFVGFLLLPTGIVVWWIKRQRKAGSADRRAATRAAPTGDSTPATTS